MKTIIILVFLSVYTIVALAQGTSHVSSKAVSVKSDKTARNMATIQLHLNSNDLKKDGSVSFSPVYCLGRREWNHQQRQTGDGIFKCEININEPVYLDINGILKTHLLKSKRFNIWWIVEPGDEVFFNSIGAELVFSGNGSKKFRLQNQLDSLQKDIPHQLIQWDSVNYKNYRINSQEDFFKWNRFLSKQLELGLDMIDQYKTVISPFAYNLIRAGFVDENIEDQFDRFYSLINLTKEKKITIQDICAIYDSIYLSITEKWTKYTAPYIAGNPAPIINKIYRQHLFNRNCAPLNSKLTLNLLFYEEALNVYSGLIREEFITSYFPDKILRKFGFTPETQKLLDQYYVEPDYEEYKKYMKKQEIVLREKVNAVIAPDFELMDIKGQIFKSSDLKGKIAILNFWTTECVQCEKMAVVLKGVEKEFRNDTNVTFVNISVDKEKSSWIKSVAEGKYTTKNGVNLYTNGNGDSHMIVNQYAITKFPSVRVLDTLGRTIRGYSEWAPELDNGKSLREIIQKNIAILKDGPYLIQNENGLIGYSFNKKKVSNIEVNKSNKVNFPVQTDRNMPFFVSLKGFLSNEPTTFKRPEKLLVLSDIEGNFEALRKLLQANKVIDKDYNWIFGEGHLVFAGDMFDRGLQVTECLWLLYSLEEKAKIAGGYVHFILGNHEIMNLQGDDRYVQQKYKDNAALIGKTIKDLYDEKNELGKWLRTKNIIEKIGDMLFVHGGISPQVARLPLTISEINKLVQPYYGKSIDSSNHYLSVLFNTRKGNNGEGYYSPFWFRGYYDHVDVDKFKDNLTLQKQLDSTLNKYDVKRIVTGHTVVADTISTHFDGKVINTDTKHAKGKSEALLIEGDHYYRVNNKGEKKLLFIDGRN